MRAFAVVLLVLFAACGDRGEDAAIERIVERGHGAYVSVVEAVEASADCAGAAAAVDRVRTARSADFAAAMALQGDPARMARARPLLEARGERYAALAERMNAAFARCRGVADFDAAVARLEQPGD